MKLSSRSSSIRAQLNIGSSLLRTSLANKKTPTRDKVSASTLLPSHSRMAVLVQESLQTYFDDLGEAPPSNLYEMVIGAVERPLLEAVMLWAKGQQTRAATALGISRSTLRTKLMMYGLDKKKGKAKSTPIPPPSAIS